MKELFGLDKSLRGEEIWCLYFFRGWVSKFWSIFFTTGFKCVLQSLLWCKKMEGSLRNLLQRKNSIEKICAWIKSRKRNYSKCFQTKIKAKLLFQALSPPGFLCIVVSNAPACLSFCFTFRRHSFWRLLKNKRFLIVLLNTIQWKVFGEFVWAQSCCDIDVRWIA